MRVYFNSSSLSGCYLYRCLMPLMANGWDGDHTSIWPDQKTPDRKKDAANASDIVVFHRPDQHAKLDMMRILQEIGKKVVVDNDDTFKDIGGFKFFDYYEERRAMLKLDSINMIFDQALREADLVTTTTEVLAKEYRKLNKSVIVLPNNIDPFYFDEPLRNETDIVRIGIVGSILVNADYQVLEPILARYCTNPKVKMVIFSLPADKDNSLARQLYVDQYALLDRHQVEWQPYVEPQYYYDTLNNLKLDMMIIPRADTYLTRCKSNLKFLEASMFEIPVIAQGFEDGLSPYQVDPKDAEHMRIVIDNSKWFEEIDAMIADKQLRLDMGKKAHAYVVDNYDINKNYHRWEEAYATLDAGKKYD